MQFHNTILDTKEIDDAKVPLMEQSIRFGTVFNMYLILYLDRSSHLLIINAIQPNTAVLCTAQHNLQAMFQNSI